MKTLVENIKSGMVVLTPNNMLFGLVLDIQLYAGDNHQILAKITFLYPDGAVVKTYNWIHLNILTS